MNDRVFVDTNILVYAHDPATGTKYVRARAAMNELWPARRGVLSTQVLQEFAFTLRRRISPPLSERETAEWIVEYMAWDVVTNTPESVLRALQLESQFQVSFWDALILQAAEKAGAPILYSEDFSDGQAYGSVRVVNPLK